MPEKQLEEYLRLVDRLEGKINLIKNTIGTDTPVLDEKENPIEFIDSWKDIYSDSLQRRMEALENAEESADLLLSEDEYVADLKIFHNNDKVSDQYKQTIYQIPRGKWAIMPRSAHSGAERAEALTLHHWHDKDGYIVGSAFISMKRAGDDIQAVTQLQALEWLRTSVSDNARELDHISIDKILIRERASSGVKAYVEGAETGAPIGQEKHVLRIMYQHQLPEKDLEAVRLAFQTKNILDRQKISKLVRQIVKAEREHAGHITTLINMLITIARSTTQPIDPSVRYNNSKDVLFYVKDNK
jgi:hypothetical protein